MNAFQLLVSKKDKNIVKCKYCNKLIKDAHLLCIRFFKKDNKIQWQSKYTVGCTHVKFDGEPWCSDCVTIADQKISCSNCSNLYWGIPQFTGNKIKYMWHDGSESSYEDLYWNLN